jgi:hypothetical protein
MSISTFYKTAANGEQHELSNRISMHKVYFQKSKQDRSLYANE